MKTITFETKTSLGLTSQSFCSSQYKKTKTLVAVVKLSIEIPDLSFKTRLDYKPGNPDKFSKWQLRTKTATFAWNSQNPTQRGGHGDEGRAELSRLSTPIAKTFTFLPTCSELKLIISLPAWNFLIGDKRPVTTGKGVSSPRNEVFQEANKVKKKKNEFSSEVWKSWKKTKKKTYLSPFTDFLNFFYPSYFKSIGNFH